MVAGKVEGRRSRERYRIKYIDGDIKYRRCLTRRCPWLPMQDREEWMSLVHQGNWSEVTILGNEATTNEEMVVIGDGQNIPPHFIQKFIPPLQPSNNLVMMVAGDGGSVTLQCFFSCFSNLV